jgi:hypothetical protein
LQVVRLDFSYFRTQVNNDVLRVYDGKTTNDRLIVALSGPINIPLVIESTQEFMLLTFESDQSVNSRGFSAAYTKAKSGRCAISRVSA